MYYIRKQNDNHDIVNKEFLVANFSVNKDIKSGSQPSMHI